MLSIFCCSKKKQKKSTVDNTPMKKSSVSEFFDQGQKQSSWNYAGGNVLFQEGKKKRIKEVLSEKGQGLILKQLSINQDFKSICEDLAELINFASKEYQHQNLVKYIHAYYDEKVFTIITEKMPITFQEIHINNDKQIRDFLMTIFEVMHFLHSQQIYNINLKSNNIFSNQIGVIKLRDYVGKSFFDLFENGSELSVDSLQRKKDNIAQDLDSVLKLIEEIEMQKNPIIKDKINYENFKVLLQTQKKNKEINFISIFNHEFLSNDQSVYYSGQQKSIKKITKLENLDSLEKEANELIEVLGESKCYSENDFEVESLVMRSERLLQNAQQIRESLQARSRQREMQNQQKKIKDILTNYNKILKTQRDSVVHRESENNLDNESVYIVERKDSNEKEKGSDVLNFRKKNRAEFDKINKKKSYQHSEKDISQQIRKQIQNLKASLKSLSENRAQNESESPSIDLDRQDTNQCTCDHISKQKIHIINNNNKINNHFINTVNNPKNFKKKKTEGFKEPSFEKVSMRSSLLHRLSLKESEIIESMKKQTLQDAIDQFLNKKLNQKIHQVSLRILKVFCNVSTT